MENLAAVERRPRAIAMMRIALRASAAENQHFARQKVFMIAAIMAKLAHVRRSPLAPLQAFRSGYKHIRIPNEHFCPTQKCTYKQFTVPQELPYAWCCSLDLRPRNGRGEK